MLQGLPTAQQLAAQLPGAMRQVRQGAYLPAQGAGLASIGVAKLASLLKVPRCHLPAEAPASSEGNMRHDVHIMAVKQAGLHVQLHHGTDNRMPCVNRRCRSHVIRTAATMTASPSMAPLRR